MFRFPCRIKRKAWAALILLALTHPHPALADDSPDLLAAFVNGEDRHVVMEIVHRDGRLLANLSELRAVGIQIGNAPAVNGLVALETISGLTWKIDQRTQEIHFTASDRALAANQISGEPEARAATTPAGFGAVMNYDLLATRLDNQTIATGVFDAHAFTPWGVLNNSWLSQNTGSERGFQRLSTSMTYSDPDRVRSYTLGDVITGGLTWSRPFRMGGFQIASNFGLRPDLVTFPVPTFGGRADVPSTVDLFVNSVRQLSQPVESGPFELRQAPILTGMNDVSVVVHDAAGRESVQSLNFYSSATMLAQGLWSYSGEVGYIRQNYGLPGDAYTRPAASASARYGLMPWLTVEIHAEGSDTTFMGGLGGSVNLGNLAIGTVSAAASNAASYSGSGGSGSPGMQYSVGLERAGRIFSFAVSATHADNRFQDVPANSFNPVPTSVIRGSLGLSLNNYGNLRLAYAQIASRAAVSSSTLGDLPNVGLIAQNAKLFSVTYTRPITPAVQLYATGYRDFANTNAAGVTVGLIIPLGGRTSASLEGGVANGRSTAAVNAAQAAVAPGDFGWRVAAGVDPTTERSGTATYDSRFGTVAGEVVNQNGSTGVRGEVTGSVAAVPQGVFVTNRINDSFAVVDTNGVPGVAIEREHRPVGETDSSGLLLVPDLNAWQVNHLTVNPNNLPADVDVGAVRQDIRPPSASGVHVTFPIHRSHTATIRLVDAQGKPLPVGEIATLVRTGQQVPIGFDGEIFLADLEGDEELRITGTKSCSARFHFTPVAGEMPTIGPITCVGQP